MLYCRRVAAITFLSVILSTALGYVTPSMAQKRLAFVVGIDRYDNLPADQQLKRAVSDARAMVRTFQDLKFKVVSGENLGREGFLIAWQNFLLSIAPGDTAAVFFAGHGVEMRGVNYLMPRDVPSAAKGELVLRGAGIPLSDILDQLNEQKPGTAFVILDACRNNPFSVSGRNIGGARGLARVDERLGTLVLYSAGIGQVALDHVPGEPAAANSVFTHTLMPLLKTSGLRLIDIAVETQRRVATLAQKDNHIQTPAFYSQLLSDVYLAGAPASPAPVPDPAAAHKAMEAEIERRIEAERKRMAADFEAERKRIAEASSVPQPAPASPSKTTPTPSAKDNRPITAGIYVPPSSEKGATAPSDPAVGISPGSGRSFRDKFADGQDCRSCPEMVIVPSGSFMMGSPKGEDRRETTEDPQHRVTIAKAFAVGRFEITRDEFEAFVSATGHSMGEGCRVWKNDLYLDDSSANWRSPGFVQNGRHPVTCVSWHDAKAYVAWLSLATRKRYALPSESAWEYVARAGTTTPFSMGRTLTTNEANYDGNFTYGNGKKGVFRQRTLEVGSFAPNAWGLYDVHGNVAEWVEDCVNNDYVGAPSNGTAWQTGVCGRRMVRGGAWLSGPRLPRSAQRYRDEAALRENSLGFRVSRTIDP